MANEPTEREVWGLAVDPMRTDRLLIADYSTLYLSSDGGRSFTKKHAVKRGDPLLIAGAFFDEQFLAVGTNAGLLISNDGGTTFELARCNGIPAGEGMVGFAAGKSGGRVRMACVTMPTPRIYSGIQGDDHANFKGFYVLDWGKSNWLNKSATLPRGTTPFFVAMAANSADTIYVGGGSAAGVPSICKTTNGGDVWQSIFLTQNNQNIITGWSGYRGDRDWPYSEFLFGLAVHATDANRLACSDYGFVHVTTDGGKLWRQAYVNPADQNPAGKPTPKGRAYRGNGLENTSSFYVTWFDAKTLWGSFADIRGIRSTDGGSSWSFDYKGHTANSSYQLVVHPTTQTAYMATSSVHDLYESSDLRDVKTDKGQGDVLFSTDKGKSWQPLGKIGMPVIALALDPNNPKRLYASAVNSQKGGIYRCQDITRGTGAQWQRLPAPPRTEGHPNTIHVLKDGTLVCTYSGVPRTPELHAQFRRLSLDRWRHDLAGPLRPEHALVDARPGHRPARFRPEHLVRRRLQRLGRHGQRQRRPLQDDGPRQKLDKDPRPGPRRLVHGSSEEAERDVRDHRDERPVVLREREHGDANVHGRRVVPVPSAPARVLQPAQGGRDLGDDVWEWVKGGDGEVSLRTPDLVSRESARYLQATSKLSCNY